MNDKTLLRKQQFVLVVTLIKLFDSPKISSQAITKL